MKFIKAPTYPSLLTPEENNLCWSDWEKGTIFEAQKTYHFSEFFEVMNNLFMNILVAVKTPLKLRQFYDVYFQR